jgi:hypothetical protein
MGVQRQRASCSRLKRVEAAVKFPTQHYLPEQIEVLHTAFYLVCAELDVKDEDVEGRERIAKAIIDLGGSGQLDIDCLKIYAEAQYFAKA